MGMISAQEPIFSTGIDEVYPEVIHLHTSSSHSEYVVVIRDVAPLKELLRTRSWSTVEEPQELIDTNPATIPTDIKYDAYRSTVTQEDEKMDIKRLKKSIADQFGGIRQVKAVYISPHKDYVEVNTVLQTRDRQTRDKLFSHQLQIHDAFPTLLIDFRVTFSSQGISARDLPPDAIVCFSK